MKNKIAVLCGTVLLLAVTTQQAVAQEARASMGGRVVDPQTAAVPNAEVVVRSETTGVEQTTKTNEQGNWAVRFLIPGNYYLRITAPAFNQVERHRIQLPPADQQQT